MEAVKYMKLPDIGNGPIWGERTVKAERNSGPSWQRKTEGEPDLKMRKSPALHWGGEKKKYHSGLLVYGAHRTDEKKKNHRMRDSRKKQGRGKWNSMVREQNHGPFNYKRGTGSASSVGQNGQRLPSSSTDSLTKETVCSKSERENPTQLTRKAKSTRRA